MKMIHYLLLFIYIRCFSSCASTHSPGDFSLIQSEKTLSFALDVRTKSAITALFPYTDEEGREYLTFQNPGQNDLLFYDMNTCDFLFRIQPAYEGNQGVGQFSGYYIKTPDSIFLTSAYNEEIILINGKAEVIDKYPFHETTDGIPLKGFSSASFTYSPLVWLDNKMYIMPTCNRWTEKNPVCASMDTKDHSVHALLGFSYPTFPGADNKAKISGAENYVSRIWDGKQFVYAFYFDEDIYVVSKDHESVRRVKVKSKYIGQVELLDDYGNLTLQDMCENPNYGNMLYDPYREVYYRVAYPPTTIEHEVKDVNLLLYGRKNFSILILDKEFNTLGETLFPDYTYNSALMFIRKDGLYLSCSHSLSPGFSDDVLCFRRFDLEEQP